VNGSRNPVSMVAVLASVWVGDHRHTASHDVTEAQYSTTQGRVDAKNTARHNLEDVVRTAHPDMSVRTAWDTAHYRSTITVERWTHTPEDPS
jgi:hypothetical protein